MTDVTPAVPRRDRSPSYPSIGLEAAIARAQAVWEQEHRHSAPITSLYGHWGYRGPTGPALRTVAALQKFGLLEDQGAREARTAKLTELALTILLAPSPDHPDRRAAIQTAALKPTIHADLWARYGAELPSDETLLYYLVKDRKFTEDAARELIREYRGTMAFSSLQESDTVAADDEAEDQHERQGETYAPHPPQPERRVLTPLDQKSGGIQTMSFPIDDVRQATLQIPGPVSVEDWEVIFDALEVFKRASTRRARAGQPAPEGSEGDTE